MGTFWRAFWSEPSVADAPRRVWRDAVLVAVLVPLAILEVVVRDDITYRWPSFAVALLGIALLPWRRTRPLLVVCLVFGATLVLDIPWIIQGGDAPGLYTMGCVLLVAYALLRWGSGCDAVVGLAVMLAVATVSAVWDYNSLSETIAGFAIFLATIALGLALRYRTRARVSKLDTIRALERESLARDLHDTVAHHVSAIAIRAQAGLATAATDPGAAVEALKVIDAEASRTLSDMRTIVRGLRRDHPAELMPLPQIADVRDLALATPGGPAVHVHLDGDPATVPAPVSTAAYRMVQESITNARRHARRASRIDVLVRTDDVAVTVQVTDDGEPGPRTSSGFGIVGMIERAQRLGGTCTAGPLGGRGWAVTAVLPLDGAAT